MRANQVIITTKLKKILLVFSKIIIKKLIENFKKSIIKLLNFIYFSYY